MSPEEVRDKYSQIQKNQGVACLDFLAKVGVAAQQRGFDCTDGRRLLSMAVELYAQHLGIDPLKQYGPRTIRAQLWEIWRCEQYPILIVPFLFKNMH